VTDGSPATLRRATAADAEAIARAAVEAVADYPDFAPPGWHGPTYEHELADARAVLGDAEYHCIVAELDGAVVGQVAVLPVARAGRPVDDPTLAHLRNLFLDRSQWGSGLASALMDAAMADARERGFAQMRLFVAEGQARARRFYEREGWSAAGEPFDDPVPGLRMVEYRRRIG
jgi:GNAT superfamily N-acetyltransferase